ncbi:MAG: ADP-ribosylglycohydrolase family protein [Gemmatimonadales bacterium]
MPRLLPALSSRAEGAVLGLAAGRSLATGDSPDGELALALILAEELAAGRADLRQVATRWVQRYQSDSRGIGQETAGALLHIARHDAPPRQGAGRSADPLIRCIPVALAMAHSPRNLVSGTYHIAAMTHPDPTVAWSAVALNIALARFLLGKRDFIPDVLEALRDNPVPEELLVALRRVPLERREQLAEELSPADAVGCVRAVLWLGYHEPLLERGVRWAAEAPTHGAALAGAAGALLGARDGVEALPQSWTAALTGTESLRYLAAALVHASSPSTG